MRKIVLMFSLMVGFNCFAQTHLEYISEPTDSMALISKQDIDIINNVFAERNMLDSLCSINEELISKLELNNRVKSAVLEIVKNEEFSTFKVEVRRSDKSFEIKSMELSFFLNSSLIRLNLSSISLNINPLPNQLENHIIFFV